MESNHSLNHHFEKNYNSFYLSSLNDRIAIRRVKFIEKLSLLCNIYIEVTLTITKFKKYKLNLRYSAMDIGEIFVASTFSEIFHWHSTSFVSFKFSFLIMCTWLWSFIFNNLIFLKERFYSTLTRGMKSRTIHSRCEK